VRQLRISGTKTSRTRVRESKECKIKWAVRVKREPSNKKPFAKVPHFRDLFASLFNALDTRGWRAAPLEVKKIDRFCLFTVVHRTAVSLTGSVTPCSRQNIAFSLLGEVYHESNQSLLCFALLRQHCKSVSKIKQCPLRFKRHRRENDGNRSSFAVRDARGSATVNCPS
jgi:hypothetical protein